MAAQSTILYGGQFTYNATWNELKIKHLSLFIYDSVKIARDKDANAFHACPSLTEQQLHTTLYAVCTLCVC